MSDDQPAEKPEEKLHALWGFACSERGVATFKTCMTEMMGAVHSKSKSGILDRYLKVLFKITHFPPASKLFILWAPKTSWPRSLCLFSPLVSVSLLSEWYPKLPLVVVFESALEGSRQIFAWIESQYHRDSSAGPDNLDSGLVKYFKLEERGEFIEQNSNPAERCETVEVLATGTSML